MCIQLGLMWPSKKRSLFSSTCEYILSPTSAYSFTDATVFFFRKAIKSIKIDNQLVYYVMYDSYLLKDVHSVLVNFPREYAQESMMLYI